MKEKKEELWQLMLEMTFDDKATYEKVMNAVNEATGKHGFVSSIGHGKVKGLHIEDKKEPEVFNPQKGDICTCVIGGNVDTIFRCNGNTTTDDNGLTWLDGDLALTWSGDLFKPYMTVYGEDLVYERDCCRPATEEEVALFHDKIKEPEIAKAKEGDKWEIGDWVYVVGSETGCCRVFYPVPVTYAETKTMENLVRRGWVFDKEEECEFLCSKLNESINDIK